ncbi:MAG TPA: 16S rRNA (cytidine(1402)-2'-O)-methyltransferase [Tenericutes bacterium]|nr:16S rRNA (cytidine(1402)-2'-O)-methyltransferase [Mycoplasmatota bacterium]
MMKQKSFDGTPILYLVPTPIGNLEDITLRALKVLKEVSIIASEDTRVTQKLLNHYDIKTKTISVHEHNENKMKDKILNYLKMGKNVALVSDRGTPIISDPGATVVKYVIENGFNVVALPGATALTTALITSGISAEKFNFYGFLDNKESKKKKELNSLKEKEETLIFYEAPHRIQNTLELIKDIMGNRKVSICRELTKLHEEIIRGNISDILENLETIKGEIVIVLEGKQEIIEKDIDYISEIKRLIKKGYSEKDAIKEISEKYNLKKNDIYNEYQKAKKE